jgi:hypothetical protein
MELNLKSSHPKSKILGQGSAEISFTTFIRPRYKACSNLSIEALSSSVIESSNIAAIKPYRSAKVILPELLT